MLLLAHCLKHSRFSVNTVPVGPTSRTGRPDFCLFPNTFFNQNVFHKSWAVRIRKQTLHHPSRPLWGFWLGEGPGSPLPTGIWSKNWTTPSAPPWLPQILKCTQLSYPPWALHEAGAFSPLLSAEQLGPSAGWTHRGTWNVFLEEGMHVYHLM